MSQLASNPQQLAAVLQMLQGPDTATIKQGEKQLKGFEKKESCLPALFSYCATQGNSVFTRLQAALLLKKNISKHVKKFSPAQVEQMKTQLLAMMVSEPEKQLSVALAGCTAKLAKSVMSKNGAWPELFQLLVDLGRDPVEARRALDYSLLGQLAEHVAQKLVPHLDVIAGMLSMGCQDPVHAVKKEAMSACSMFLSMCGESDEIMKLQIVLGPMVGVMGTCLQNGDEESVCEGLEVLSDCATLEKPLINDHLEMLVPFLLAIVQTANLEDSTKMSAHQTLNQLIESRPRLLASKSLVLPILTAMAQIISASEGSPCGSLYMMPGQPLINDEKPDDEDEDYEDDEHNVAQMAQVVLNAMAIHIPSKFFTDPALHLASQCISSPDAKMRKAGTAIVGIIAEGCSDSLKPKLDGIMPALLGAMVDSDVFVREVACFALGQFAEYLQPDVLHFNQSVLPVIAQALEDPEENVRNTACYDLEMYVENLQKETLRPHLPRLMQQLAVMLQSPSRRSQEMALAGIGACAVASESDFAPYTPGTCGLLTQLILLADPKQFALRGRSLECLGHIAVAVGAETFSPYFEYSMNSAVNALQYEDDNLKEHSYVFFANSAKVMGASGRLTPYFPTIVPYLLEVVDKEEIVEGDDEEDEEDDDGGSQDLAGAAGGAGGDDDDEELEGKDLYLNVEEGFINGKKAALTALGAFCEHCGQAFTGHLESVLKAVMDPEGKGAVDSEHEIVRSEAVEILRFVFANLCQVSGMAELQPKTYTMLDLSSPVSVLGRLVIQQCIRTIETDVYKKPVAAAIETIESVLATAGASLLMLSSENPDMNPAWSGPLGGVLIDIILLLLQEKTPCQEKAGDEGGEDDEDHDQDVIDSVSDLIGRLAKQMGPGFEVYFDRMLPLLLKYCKPARPFSDRSMAIGCFAEVVAELGPAALKYQDHLLPIVQSGLGDPMEGVRRNCAYFLGQLVESTGTALVPFFSHILGLLAPLCSRPDSKKALDAGGADVDNALSAVARMIRVSKENVPLAQVLSVFLSALPLQSDFSEGLNIFTCFIGLLQQGDATVMSFLPQVLVAFAHTLVHDSKYDDETKGAVASFLKSSITLPHMQAALSQLPQEVSSVLVSV